MIPFTEGKFHRVFVICGGILAGAILSGGIFGSLLFWSNLSVPDFSQIRNSYHPSDIWVLDSLGRPLEAIRTNQQERSLDWVQWTEVSPAFAKILVEVEDKRYWQHQGVDFLALSHGVLQNFSNFLSHNNQRRGSSTLTMQVVGMSQEQLKIRDPHGYPRRSVLQKLKQILLSLKMERSWTKEQIAEAYINLVSIRGELKGLRAASLGYFNKGPSGITSEDAALLIALLRAPNAKPDLIAKRACQILPQDCASLKQKALERFSSGYQILRDRSLLPIYAPRFYSKKDSPLKIKSAIETTLDKDAQVLTMELLREQLSALHDQNVSDGAVLILDTLTGDVVAYAANGGPGSSSADQTDGIQMRRQAGSTIKPFVYATALDLGLIKPDSLLEDLPTDITVGPGKVYHPRNYDHQFRGLISVAEALASSVNVPAVRTLGYVGEERVLKNLQHLGFTQLQNVDGYYGPSLALGSIDVSLWELTHAYRALANLHQEDSPFSVDTKKNIFSILSNPENRRFTFGMESLLNLPFPAAVKTGTSKDMRDNWCVGWSRRWTVGVWVGNFNGQPMWNVSGISGAAPIWRRIMQSLPQLETEPKYATTATTAMTNLTAPTEPSKPTESTESTVQSLRSVQSVQSAPSAPSANQILSHSTLTKIRYPAPEMLIGFDPDIPAPLQKMPIEIENPQPSHRLYLNGVLLAKAQEAFLWPVKKGKFQLELRTAKGLPVDKVQFEVR